MTYLTSLSTALLLALPVASSIAPAAHAAETRPNIVVLLADDLRADCIGALNPHIRTPNMDRLAKSGVLFNHCYGFGSTTPAVCIPSRTMIMSGSTLLHMPKDKPVRGLKKGQPYPPPSVPVMATTFRDAGYDSLYSGKPKNFDAACHAFDETFNPGGSGPLTMGLEEQQKIRRRYADTVISFLAKPERKTKPFFVFYAPLNPHDPLFPETDCSTWYQGDKTPKLPPNAAVDHQAWAGLYQLDTACRTYAAPAVGKGKFLPPFDLKVWPKVIGEYYAQVSSFDREVGRMLDALESNGQLKNTIIILSSDNGLALTDHGLMHKSSLYEHDIKLPMIISGPGIPEDKRSDAFVYVSDMFPTMCELTGIPIPSTVQMKSFRPSILDPQEPNRKSMYFIYSEEMRAFRDE